MSVAESLSLTSMKIPLSLLPLIIVCLTGCSSGGTGVEESNELELSENEIDTPVAAENPVLSDDDLDSEGTNPTGNEPDSVAINPTGQDPLIPNTTRVTFDITVPAYQSNELSVALVWGEINLSAMWVGDEYWTASSDFPTQTEDNLTVTFYDENGNIELASFSQVFRTGSNDSESFQILVDQFDASQYDIDGDGVSNLDELVAGNDPQINESSEPEIRDVVTLPADIMTLSQLLEAGLSEERPYTETFSEFIPASEEEDSVGITIRRDTHIDADGNGEVSHSRSAPWYEEGHDGIRTNSGNSIAWEGGYTTYDGDYSRSRSFSSQVTVVDAGMRDFIQDIDDAYSGTFRDTWETSSNVTGELIEGTSRCKPIFGTISRSHGTNRSNFFNSSTITVSKEEGDQYWWVVEEVGLLSGENEIIEYFARDLILSGSNAEDREYPTFICTFVDL